MYFCKVKRHICLFLRVRFVKKFDESCAVCTFVIFKKPHRFWIEFRFFDDFVGIWNKYVFAIRTLAKKYDII